MAITRYRRNCRRVKAIINHLRFDSTGVYFRKSLPYKLRSMVRSITFLGYTHMHIHTCIHVCTHAHLCTHTSAHAQYIHTLYTHIYAHTHIRARTYTCTHYTHKETNSKKQLHIFRRHVIINMCMHFVPCTYGCKISELMFEVTIFSKGHKRPNLLEINFCEASHSKNREALLQKFYPFFPLCEHVYNFVYHFNLIS